MAVRTVEHYDISSGLRCDVAVEVIDTDLCLHQDVNQTDEWYGRCLHCGEFVEMVQIRSTRAK